MGQRLEAITQHLAARWCWQAARRDATRVAPRLSRQHVVDGVYRRDEGARLDDVFHFLRELGVLGLMAGVPGQALQRAMVPCVQYLLLDSLKTLGGSESMHARPA